MVFHEIGHLVFGSVEEACDKYAFYHALAAGVSPFVCYLAIRAYMPEHYNYRIFEMFKNLVDSKHLNGDIQL